MVFDEQCAKQAIHAGIATTEAEVEAPSLAAKPQEAAGPHR